MVITVDFLLPISVNEDEYSKESTSSQVIMILMVVILMYT